MENINYDLSYLGKEGVLFHAVSLNIMRNSLPEDIYVKYSNVVTELLSNYLAGASGDIIERNQLEADNEYNNTLFLISNILENVQDYDVKGDLIGYMLVPIATQNCLFGMSDFSQTEVINALNQISFNSERGEFHGEFIDMLTSKYNSIARKELDGVFDQ